MAVQVNSPAPGFELSGVLGVRTDSKFSDLAWIHQELGKMNDGGRESRFLQISDKS